jgi:glycosyltransferase involved in cell wall biosynthesis
MRRRKAAYLTPLYFDERSCLGGGERYPLNLARGVVAASGGAYSVELISFGDVARWLTLAPGVTLRVLPAAGRRIEPLDVVSWDLPEALHDADVVHIHQAYTRCSEMGLLVAKQQRKPVCITDHGGFTSPLGLELGSLELADRIVAYSDFGASLYPATTTPIVVIKGGVDARLFTPPDDRPARDRVAYVGRLLPHKGIDRLIEALPADLPLIVCGRPYRDDYFQYLQALSAGKALEFVTDADDEAIRRLYARAWAVVLPSVYRDCYGNVHRAPELMGFTLLEAMACGTPAICSRVGAMPEFVRDGQTGFVFDGPDDLADRLRALAGTPGLADEMGTEARRVVEVGFDLEVAGAKLLAVYEELLARARGVAA